MEEEKIEIELEEEIDEDLNKLLFESILDEEGKLTFTDLSLKTLQKENDKYYFAGTLLGYEDKFDRPVRFMKGVHENKLTEWKGKKFLLWHNDKMIPLGKIEETWMQDGNIKFIAWTDNKDVYEAVKKKKLVEVSAGIKPKKLGYDKEEKKFVIKDYQPLEFSMVNYQGYEPAKIEVIGTDKEKVKEASVKEEFRKLEEEKEKLEKELKILAFKKKHIDAKNIDEIVKLMGEYDMSEEDAEKLIIVEEEQEVNKEEPVLEENQELPRRTEPIVKEVKEKTKEEIFRETLEERVNNVFRRGYK